MADHLRQGQHSSLTPQLAAYLLPLVTRRPHESMVSAQCAAAAAAAATAWTKQIPSSGPGKISSNSSQEAGRSETPAVAICGAGSPAAAAAEPTARLGAFAAAAHFAAAYEAALEQNPALGLSPPAQRPDTLAAFAASGVLSVGSGALIPDPSPHPLLPALLATLEQCLNPEADTPAAECAAAAAEALDGIATVAAALALRRRRGSAGDEAAAAAGVLPYIGQPVDAMVGSFPPFLAAAPATVLAGQPGGSGGSYASCMRLLWPGVAVLRRSVGLAQQETPPEVSVRHRAVRTLAPFTVAGAAAGGAARPCDRAQPRGGGGGAAAAAPPAPVGQVPHADWTPPRPAGGCDPGEPLPGRPRWLQTVPLRLQSGQHCATGQRWCVASATSCASNPFAEHTVGGGAAVLALLPSGAEADALAALHRAVITLNRAVITAAVLTVGGGAGCAGAAAAGLRGRGACSLGLCAGCGTSRAAAGGCAERA